MGLELEVDDGAGADEVTSGVCDDTGDCDDIGEAVEVAADGVSAATTKLGPGEASADEVGVAGAARTEVAVADDDDRAEDDVTDSDACASGDGAARGVAVSATVAPGEVSGVLVGVFDVAAEIEALLNVADGLAMMALAEGMAAAVATSEEYVGKGVLKTAIVAVAVSVVAGTILGAAEGNTWTGGGRFSSESDV